jgi:hypothetical protein
MNSSNLAAALDSILERFPSKRNLIIWLDYTGARRREQFQQTVQTLIRLRHGDIFRITLNANPQTLSSGSQWRKAGAVSPAAYRADQLRTQIQEFFPNHVDEIVDTTLPAVLAQCVRLATEAARTSMPNLRYTPVLITSYSDGTPMLTVTCAVADIDQRDRFPSQYFRRWKYACRGWDDIQTISAPVLSLREQYRLDANLHRGARRMLSALRFLPGEDEEASLNAIKSYKAFNRFYPTFRHINDA